MNCTILAININLQRYNNFFCNACTIFFNEAIKNFASLKNYFIDFFGLIIFIGAMIL